MIQISANLLNTERKLSALHTGQHPLANNINNCQKTCQFSIANNINNSLKTYLFLCFTPSNGSIITTCSLLSDTTSVIHNESKNWHYCRGSIRHCRIQLQTCQSQGMICSHLRHQFYVRVVENYAQKYNQFGTSIVAHMHMP